jgi:hypothetical protein
MRIDPEAAHKLYEYDPTHPLALRWKWVHKQNRRTKVGDIAGHWHPVHAGSAKLERYVSLPGEKRAPVKYVVWVLVNGTDPPTSLGTKPDSPNDFRIENLIANHRRAPDEVLRQKQYRHNKKHYEWRKNDPYWQAYFLERNLRVSYGITVARYEAMVAAHAGLCGICKRPETMIRRGKLQRLSIDHCHGAKKVRGLLCASCNNGLGRFGDDPARLRAAADYLERHAEAPTE